MTGEIPKAQSCIARRGTTRWFAHRLLASPSLSKIPAFFRADMTAASVAFSGVPMGGLLARLTGCLADFADLGLVVALCGVAHGFGDWWRDMCCGWRAPAASFAGEAWIAQWSEGCAEWGRTRPSGPACCTHHQLRKIKIERCYTFTRIGSDRGKKDTYMASCVVRVVT